MFSIGSSVQRIFYALDKACIVELVESEQHDFSS